MPVILTWNPDAFEAMEDSFDDNVAVINDDGWTSDWSVANRKNGIGPGDTAYLLRQGKRGTGLVLRGVIESPPFEGPHWDPDRRAAGDTSMYVDVTWWEALPRDEWVHIEELIEQVPGIPWKAIFSSGFTKIADPDAKALNDVWVAAMGGVESPQIGGLEFDGDEVPGHVEGAKVTVQVNRYERDPKARAACIAAHGTTCLACGFDFEAFYGVRGTGYIVVHHLKPLASLEGASTVDPVKDMVPLCANCHAMVHRTEKPMSIPALKKLIQANA